MNISQSDKYWIWLSAVPDLSSNDVAGLLKVFGDAEGIYREGRTHRNPVRGAGERVLGLLQSTPPDVVDRILSVCEKTGLLPVTITSDAYPERLRNIYSPPGVLYVKGILPDLDNQAVVAVIGTRKPSPYGIRMAKRITEELLRCGGTVLSLLTAGIDLAVAETAAEDGICVGVLGTSHDRDSCAFSAEISKKGAIISEYPPGTRSSRYHFRERNRIASGLCVGTVVVEAPRKSGTFLFVRDALEQNKDIYAVPGNADSELSAGTLELIRSGAKPIVCGWDILREYKNIYSGISEPDEAISPVSGRETSDPAGGSEAVRIEKLVLPLDGLSDEQRCMVEVLGNGPVTAEMLIETTGLSAAKVLSQLTILEIKGIIGRSAEKGIYLKNQ